MLAEGRVNGVADDGVREPADSVEEVLVVAEVAYAEQTAGRAVDGQDAVVAVDDDRADGQVAQYRLVEDAQLRGLSLC